MTVKVPKGWELKKLDELGFVGRGKSKHRPRDASHLYGGPYPFIQTGDVKHANFYITDYKQTYSEAGLSQSKLWRKGTLCITIAANIADTAILGLDACFPDSIIGFVADENESDGRFVKYLFYILQRNYQQFTQGSTQDNLSQEKLLSLRFPVPLKNIQERIASILVTYDDLIENNLRRIELLEESARLLYREWFVHLLFPGHEHTKITNGMPEEWRKKLLSELAYLTMGQSPKSQYYNEEGEGLPFHQGVTDFGARFVTHNKYCTVQNRIAEEGDILCSVRAPVGRLNITLDKIVIGRGLSSIRSKNNNQSFLYYQLKSYFFQENIIGGGTIFASTTKEQLSNQELLQPKKKLIEIFEEFSKPIDKQIKNLFLINQQLQKAKYILLPRLMNGDIAV